MHHTATPATAAITCVQSPYTTPAATRVQYRSPTPVAPHTRGNRAASARYSGITKRLLPAALLALMLGIGTHAHASQPAAGTTARQSTAKTTAKPTTAADQPTTQGSAATAPAETPRDGAPLSRFTIEELLAPTNTKPLAGNQSTVPNAEGQYTVYAMERKIQELAAHLRAGEYEPVAKTIADLREQRTQTTDGFSAASYICKNITNYPSVDKDLLQWLASDSESQVANLLYGIWCIDEAWRHRGSGWASSVTQEGWEGFYTYLTFAKSALEKAFALDANDYIAAACMITVELGLGDSRSTRYQWFERATKIYPDYYQAYSTLSTALLPRWGGFPAEARLFTQHNSARGPQFPMLYYRWLYTENEKEYLTENTPVSNAAWEILEKYRIALPNSGNAYRNMGIMQENFGNKEKALEYAEKSVLLDPSSSNRYNYARRLHTLRQNAQSIAELKAAIELSPGEAIYWDWLGRNYFTIKARNLPLAIECFTRAIELNSSSRWLLVDRGRCYMILGDFQQALPNFEAAAERWPDFDQAFYHLGTALLRTGHKEAAQQAFDRAIELNDKNRERVEKYISQHSK